MSFHQLSQKEGLSYARNYAIYQDFYGFIWISTTNGLDRFDGQNVEHFSLEGASPAAPASDNVTSRCFEDPDKNLWFTTFSGICCYRRASGRFESFPAVLPGVLDFYAFHLDVDRRLWVRIGSGMKGKLLLFDTQSGKWQRLGALQGEQCHVMTDASGRVTQIITTVLPDKKPGLTITDVDTWKIKSIEFKTLSKSKGSVKIPSPTKGVLVDGDSVIWTGLYNGLGKYQIQQEKALKEKKRDTLDVAKDFGWVYDVLAFDASRLLVACEDGLLVFDKRQGRFVQQFRYYPGIPGTLLPGEIKALYLDPSRTLWLCGPDGGIAFTQLSKNKFPALSEVVGNTISALYEDKQGRIWCSSRDSGAYVYDASYNLQFQAKQIDNLEQGHVFPLEEMALFWEDPPWDLWGFSVNQFLRWKETEKRFEYRKGNFFGVPSTAADIIKANCRLADGTRLVAQGTTVFQLKTGPLTVDSLPWLDVQAFQLQEVSAIFQSKKGHLYLADNQYRMVVLDLSGSKARQIADFKDVGECRSFAETDDGRVWAATSKGLFCVWPGTFEGKLLTAETDGIPNELYYNILPDKQGCLWLTGNNGLIRYDLKNKTCHRFGTPDGLLSNVFSPNAALCASTTGAFWVGGKNGVNVFQPEAIHLLDTRPSVQITRLLVNDTVFYTGKDLSALEYLNLNYTDNTLSLYFSAMDYSAPGYNQYYYRMRGIEKDSVFNGTRNFVRYANLPPGGYTFEVWATNSDGLLSPEPRRLQIYIRPPFWQTWWFYLLCTLTAAGLIYGWFWYRLQQALRIERMRVQISSDLHDDVGTLLAGLAMQSEALEMTALEKDKGKLRRISEISRNAMAHMRDTVWAIDARKDKVENLLDRMREHAEETLTPKDFRFELSADNVLLKQNLPTHIRQNLYLIYKEAVTNAAKHSNGDIVSVSLKKVDKGLEMRICDNGQAAEKTYKTTGLGTSNMRMRAEKIGATLEVSRDNGFCVTLRLGGLS